jgi:hypothetical protein
MIDQKQKQQAIKAALELAIEDNKAKIKMAKTSGNREVEAQAMLLDKKLRQLLKKGMVETKNDVDAIMASLSTITNRLDPVRFGQLSIDAMNRQDACLTAMELVALHPTLPTYED